MSRWLEQAIGALNGAVGDYLVRRGNGLATAMQLVHEGAPLPLDRASIARAHPSAGPRLVVLVHGLMSTEHVWLFADGSDYGSLLARDLGMTPFYVRYNSGLPIPESGARLAELLERLVAAYPVESSRLVLVGHSMGGLVVRSACHAAGLAGHAWLPRVERAIYLGTPHLGAPLERATRLALRALRAVPDPYAHAAADVVDLRSVGVKDLGDAHLRDEDRARAGARPPLDPSIAHLLVAGTLSGDPRVTALVGDAMVPLPSATDGLVDARGGAAAPEHVKIIEALGHVGLAHDARVYEQIRAFCEVPS
jgi:pimeloyl-ACP methyl ester carboxylesterase